MADELTAEAKAEIADAIRIIREDRFERFVRGRFPEPKKDPEPTPPANDPPKTDPPKNEPPKNEPPTPPKNEPPAPPANDPPSTRKRGIWWGETGDDE